MAGSFKFGQQIQDGEIILIDKLMVWAQCFINTHSSLLLFFYLSLSYQSV